MHRFVRPTALAIGMFAILASCVPDHAVSPKPALTTQSGVRTASARMPDVRISEIHYDNTGADAGEGVEISGPKDFVVEGWKVVPYNGADGKQYNPIKTLTGRIPATCGDRGVIFVPIAGLQNGSPDGVALVDAGNAVIEFLSYEGAFTAVDGPAAGRTSTNIGVLETGGSSEPAAPPADIKSLQRSGADVWTGPITNTFGACNDVLPPTTPVATITVTPTAATILAGQTQAFIATAFDAEGNPIPGAPLAWVSSAPDIASVDANGVARGLELGDAEITVSAPSDASARVTIHVNELPDLPPTSVSISEIHYDNDGTDSSEAIEVEGPTGTSFEGWSLVLYNGNGGVSYDTKLLTGLGTASCGDRELVAVSYPSNGIQNGSPDGVALVNAAGNVVEFLSYEGTFRATNGPAAGRKSIDIGVDEPSSSGIGRSLQKDALGWYGPATSSFGRCNVAPPPFVSITGRQVSDPPLPVGFEDQLFATFNDGRGGTAPSTFVWTSETPDLVSIDEDGVMHALGAGTAILRATAPDGATGTISLPTAVAVASTTASYVGNTEFGDPTDSDPSDDFIVRRAQYTTSFNRNRGIPNWVSFNLEATHFGDQDRCDCFTFDPALPANFTHYTTADYTGAAAVAGFGIDRGHLARSFDRTSASYDNATTFLFSNIVPQASDNNQGPWAAMEIAMGDLARFQNKELYIIAGASGSQGTVKNEGKITIPEYVWKVVVIMPRNQGLASVQSYRDLEIVAVIMPNRPGIRNVNWEEYKTTVNAVEALSGYDVLALLQDRIESVVESGMQDLMAAVDALVESEALSKGNANSLQSKVEAAAASIERGNFGAAGNQLGAFVNEVNAMERSRRLTAAQAESLRSLASQKLTSLAN